MQIQTQAETFAYRLAMADTAPWQNRIVHYRPAAGEASGSYAVPELGSLEYHHEGDASSPETFVDYIDTHPDHQGQGIAQSLIERLHQDHPGHKINPGRTTQEGAGFTQHLLDEDPDRRGLLTNPQWSGFTP